MNPPVTQRGQYGTRRVEEPLSDEEEAGGKGMIKSTGSLHRALDYSRPLNFILRHGDAGTRPTIQPFTYRATHV